MDVGTKMSTVGRLMLKSMFQSAGLSCEYIFLPKWNVSFIYAVKPYLYCPGNSLSTFLTSVWHFFAISITFFYFCSHFPFCLPLWLCSCQESFKFMTLKSPPCTSHLSPIFLPMAPVQHCLLFLECPFTPIVLKRTPSVAYIPRQPCFSGSCKDSSDIELWRCMTQDHWNFIS